MGIPKIRILKGPYYNTDSGAFFLQEWDGAVKLIVFLKYCNSRPNNIFPLL